MWPKSDFSRGPNHVVGLPSSLSCHPAGRLLFACTRLIVGAPLSPQVQPDPPAAGSEPSAAHHGNKFRRDLYRAATASTSRVSPLRVTLVARTLHNVEVIAVIIHSSPLERGNRRLILYVHPASAVVSDIQILPWVNLWGNYCFITGAKRQKQKMWHWAYFVRSAM